MTHGLYSDFQVPVDLESATRELNAWIEVDCDALAANAAVIRGWMLPQAPEIIGIVKANAYGHGAPLIAHEYARIGIERLAVVWAAEGVALREAGIEMPIVVLGHSFPGDAPAAVEHGLALTVHSLELGQAISAAAVAAGRTARVHMKVDTGLHRFGVDPAEAIELGNALRGLPGIEVEGLWTHTANADEPDDSYSGQQLAAFETVVEALPWIPYRHAANSASALRQPGLRLTGVRIGLSLYGVVPSEHVPAPVLTPVLSLKARVARVTHLDPGEGVSYGLTWKATEPADVALIPVGYGDGWKRQLGDRADVLIAGRRCRIRGRVMMDHVVVDVTGLSVREGDVAVLLGAQGEERVDASELGERAGTISWDILASLQARLPRLAVRSGRVVARL